MNARSDHGQLLWGFPNDGRLRGCLIGVSAELSESAERLDLLRAIDRRPVERVAEDLDRAIVCRAVDRERGAILATMRERKARRIAKARRRAVNQLRRERQRAHRSRSNTGNPE